jgi:hypothetical protein
MTIFRTLKRTIIEWFSGVLSDPSDLIVDGNANAKVYEPDKVYGNAKVYEPNKVYGNLEGQKNYD